MNNPLFPNIGKHAILPEDHDLLERLTAWEKTNHSQSSTINYYENSQTLPDSQTSLDYPKSPEKNNKKLKINNNNNNITNNGLKRTISTTSNTQDAILNTEFKTDPIFIKLCNKVVQFSKALNVVKDELKTTQEEVKELKLKSLEKQKSKRGGTVEKLSKYNPKLYDCHQYNKLNNVTSTKMSAEGRNSHIKSFLKSIITDMNNMVEVITESPTSGIKHCYYFDCETKQNTIEGNLKNSVCKYMEILCCSKGCFLKANTRSKHCAVCMKKRKKNVETDETSAADDITV